MKFSILASTLLLAVPVLAQPSVKDQVLKHIKTSRDFTLKVANQMPEADYGFKLTPPQMGFGEQMAHLSSEQPWFLEPFMKEKKAAAKPASIAKKDVIAFVQKSFDESIAVVSTLTPNQITKTYKLGGQDMTGLEVLMYFMDHITHHRASAEMYLRAKGITPAEYEF